MFHVLIFMFCRLYVRFILTANGAINDNNNAMMDVYRGDVQGTAVADSVGSRRQSVRMSRTSSNCQLRRHVLSSEVPHARWNLQQPASSNAWRITVSAVEAAATAIREQLQLPCRSVLTLFIRFIYNNFLKFVSCGRGIVKNSQLLSI